MKDLSNNKRVQLCSCNFYKKALSLTLTGALMFMSIAISPVKAATPVISHSGPSGIVNNGNVTLFVSTDPADTATCKYDADQVDYNSMTKNFYSTEPGVHKQDVTGLSDGDYSYYVLVAMTRVETEYLVTKEIILWRQLIK